VDERSGAVEDDGDAAEPGARRGRIVEREAPRLESELAGERGDRLRAAAGQDR